MLKVGLTGGIGSGKSTVSQMLKEMGLTIIDADVVSREVLEKYPQIRESIKHKFGESFFDDNGRLMRRVLGNFVFKYPEERKKLEEIMMPYIKLEIFKKLDEYYKRDVKICILDAPTLIEQGLNETMDLNILVWVDRNTQMTRIRERDGLTDDNIIDRINSQMDIDKKREYVDFVVDNTLDLSYTNSQVRKIAKKLIEYCAE